MRRTEFLKGFRSFDLYGLIKEYTLTPAGFLTAGDKVDICAT